MATDSKYEFNSSNETWYCNTHQRRATYLFHGKHVCDPSLGGILMPCSCVNLTEIAEIEEGQTYGN
jgi:hypothetical protein